MINNNQYNSIYYVIYTTRLCISCVYFIQTIPTKSVGTLSAKYDNFWNIYRNPTPLLNVVLIAKHSWLPIISNQHWTGVWGVPTTFGRDCLNHNDHCAKYSYSAACLYATLNYLSDTNLLYTQIKKYIDTAWQ